MVGISEQIPKDALSQSLSSEVSNECGVHEASTEAPPKSLQNADPQSLPGFLNHTLHVNSVPGVFLC